MGLEACTWLDARPKEARLKDSHDAIVIGTGLAGGWAAKELCESGLRVLALDAGPLLGAHEASARRHNRSPETLKRQPIQGKHPAYWQSNPKLFVDDIEHPYRSDTNFQWIRGRQVGGRSLTWGGVTLRFSDHEFLAPERDEVATSGRSDIGIWNTTTVVSSDFSRCRAQQRHS